jgi:hypothetical protein
VKWAASSVIALAVALGGLSALHDVNGSLRPLDVLVLSMVGVLFAWLCLDLIARRPLDAMWARLIVVAAATTFGLFVGAPWAWVGYAAAAAVLVAMFARSHRRHRVVKEPYELRADAASR